MRNLYTFSKIKSLLEKVVFATAIILGIGAGTAEAAVALGQCGGWLETAYATWENATGVDSYNVYVAPTGGESWTKLDDALVRDYGTTGRADALGLKAGSYKMKVVPVVAGEEVAADASETGELEVRAHDRGGFAHFNYSEGIGAYNNDGTLKAGAKVLYVTAETAKTISTEVVTESNGKKTACTGFQTIIDAYQKAKDSTPIAFRIIGKVSKDDLDHISSSSEGVQIKSSKNTVPMNITIEGVGDDATVWGFGFLIRSALSVEFRNFGLMNYMDDGLSFDTDNAHCWAHNIDIFYGQAGGDSDQAKGDGSVDVKGNSKYMTFSYIHFWDSGKSSLCGMKSESGPNYITYHHNWFDHSDSRHPRVRTMTVHVYNNYFDGCSKYGVGATTGANVFVEANYFRNTKNPIMTSMQGTDVYAGTKTRNPGNYGTFSNEFGGSIKSYGNIMTGNYTYVPYGATDIVVKGNKTTAAAMGYDTSKDFDAYEAATRDERVPKNLFNYYHRKGEWDKSQTVYTETKADSVYSNFDTDASVMYSYTPDKAEDVPSVVRGAYGAGRCNHGDVEYEFSDAEDTNSGVISGLKTKVLNFKSVLKGFYGHPIGGGSEEPGGDDPEEPENPDNPDNPAPSVDSDWTCTFTKEKKWTSANYTISGNIQGDKGTAVVDGKTYEWALKLENSTSIKFTLPEDATMTVVFGNKDTAYDLKVDDNKKTGSAGTLVVQLSAGAHELKKASTGNIFYISMTFASKPTSTASAKALIVVEETVIDLTGKRVSKDTRGLVIVKQKMSDGTVRSFRKVNTKR
ncbi:MAG: pectate lyase [Bacteroidales bacterium]|nr:pectate lyase [Bacteroidales bacterium]